MDEKRRLINQQNAKRSTGPRTERGKARSRLNATKHSGYRRVTIEGEDTSRYKQLQLDLLSEYQPMGFEEKLIVNEIGEVIWRKNRFKVAESKAIEAYMNADFGRGVETGDVGVALAQDSGAYGTIPKCLAVEGTLDRRLWGLFDRLRKMQKRRGFSPVNSIQVNAPKLIQSSADRNTPIDSEPADRAA